MLTTIENVMPNFPQLLMRRFRILKGINELSPIGRRALADKLDLTERVLRNEVAVLKDQSLIVSSKKGMSLTQLGKETLIDLEKWIDEQSKIQTLDKRLAEKLNIDHTLVVSGNSDQSPHAFKTMAKAAVDLLASIVPEGSQTIAVMGGTTIKEVARQMTDAFGDNRDLLFVPARGGLGEDSSLEANVIADRMAEKTGGESRSLYAPDHVNAEIYQYLIEEPDIKRTLTLLEESSVLVYSIGEAGKMAKRRGLDDQTIQEIKDRRAVAEAFGEFINEDGEIVYKLMSVGLQSENLHKIPHIVIVAGGDKKAKAIVAHLKAVPFRTWLVTDEAAANVILNGVSH